MKLTRKLVYNLLDRFLSCGVQYCICDLHYGDGKRFKNLKDYENVLYLGDVVNSSHLWDEFLFKTKIPILQLVAGECDVRLNGLSNQSIATAPLHGLVTLFDTVLCNVQHTGLGGNVMYRQGSVSHIENNSLIISHHPVAHELNCLPYFQLVDNRNYIDTCYINIAAHYHREVMICSPYNITVVLCPKEYYTVIDIADMVLQQFNYM